MSTVLHARKDYLGTCGWAWWGTKGALKSPTVGIHKSAECLDIYHTVVSGGGSTYTNGDRVWN